MGRHKQYLGEIVDLFNTVWGGMSSAYWSWKHIDNPLWAQSEPELALCFENGRLVGANGFMPVVLRYNRQDIRAMQSCDTMVHPDYRGRHIFSRMLICAEHRLCDLGYVVLYGFPNDNSLPGFLHQGWQVVESVRQWGAATSVMALVRRVSREGGAARRPLPCSDGSSETESIRTDSRLTLRWHRVVPVCISDADKLLSTDRIELARWPGYLAWRLDGNPASSYRYLTATSGGELLGYMVLGLRPRGNAIVDHRVRQGDSATLRTLGVEARRWLGKNAVGLTRVWGSGPEVSQILGKSPRLHSGSLLYGRRVRPIPLMVRPLRASVPVAYLDPGVWSVTPLYADTF